MQKQRYLVVLVSDDEKIKRWFDLLLSKNGGSLAIKTIRELSEKRFHMDVSIVTSKIGPVVTLVKGGDRAFPIQNGSIAVSSELHPKTAA